MHPLHKHVRYNIFNYQEPCRNLILNINLFKQNKITLEYRNMSQNRKIK